VYDRVTILILYTGVKSGSFEFEDMLFIVMTGKHDNMKSWTVLFHDSGSLKAPCYLHYTDISYADA
jgi:hypothetical protein